MFWGWLHSAASLYALALSLCEAWGLYRDARDDKPRDPKQDYFLLCEWFDREPFSDPKLLRIKVAQELYSWVPGRGLWRCQWEKVRETAQVRGHQKPKAKPKLRTFEVGGKHYPLTEEGGVTACSHHDPMDVHIAMATANHAYEMAEMMDNDDMIVGDWSDPRWGPASNGRMKQA